ncbi:MAG TPA: PEGA domain-containing protein [Verrucomicrobiae bacterium]|jgi:hypothetical protein
MRSLTALSLAVALFATENIFAADTAAAPPRKVLIIVENRADAALNDKISVLEDLVSSRIAGKGFAVVSRDVAINALKTYQTVGVSATAKSSTEDKFTSSPDHLTAKSETIASDSAHLAATPETTKLDQALSDNSSALRLAQNLGVDFILIPSITGYGTEKKSYNGNGIQTLNVTHRLRVSYKIAEANEGGAVRGGAFVSEKTTRDTANLQTDSADTLNELLADAADQLADAITTSATSLPTEVAKAAMVNFSIACTMTDPRQQPILMSAVSVSADNKVIATNQPIVVQPMDVTVELDGVAIGSAPGEFKGRPGLHKLRLSREGFADWERTINIYNGQKLRVAMQMSEDGYAKWKDTTGFLSALDNNRKLTDAEVKQIEGMAKFLSESHYRVDTKENIRINKSLY